ncbi:MAG: M16 family metallopeptidase [Nitrospiria bacterium]
MRLRFSSLIFSLLTLFFVNPLHATAIQKTVLDNGLNVVLWEEHKAPVVTFQIWYKVGSRNEVSGKTGLSHLMEHMMFKGTEKYGKGAFSRIVAKNGGTENAFTGNDYTAYFENLSADRIGLSLELESDRMQHLLIDPEEFLLERDVVMEERRTRTDDDPYSYLVENLYAIAFLVHPYHTPVIGWMSDLENLSREDIAAHYRTYYVPNNATIVAVGDFDAEALLEKIKRHFGTIPQGPDPPQRVPPEPEQIGMRRSIVKREAQLPFVFIGYPAPNYTSPDTYALTVLSNILSNGKSARLYHSLVYTQQIALETGGYYSGLTTDPEIFYLYATAQKGTTPEALEAALDAEIRRIQTEGVTQKELEKAQNQIEAEYLMASDSNFYRGMQVGTAETVGAGYQYVLDYTAEIRKVTTEDVRRAAQTYLIEDKKNVGILIPKTKQEHP